MAEEEQAGPGSTMGYEQARDELVEVVRRLEAGGATLEESLALWERGEELAGICRGFLAGARARLDAALAEPEEPEDGGAPAGSEAGAES
ncbi:exodeoxyribonuclease VII small subunit [Streptomyces durbertensis]|uniref:Exodeoxyribonuclease 7 small subunit n=1 Tax=Streptomyces durbertensis TaxID=2448886 RepID=A0ABR6EJ02_9ACTN|nr:exodeoxyribonuclease VII small subunit [Streptomyces durbertensis]MBB1245313.1 exodeoxyribonuclease VII small subunit [Streptomyces durbertensis]